MKTSKNKVVPSLNEVEDLTLCLDENFDTEEVDLFEFTNAADSPLRQLKSIVLSLDWEITDATLEKLSQEIEHLRELEIFHNDQVSQIYLQGLDKVGSYIRAEQADAHPNAMKLLMTLYYDFEKIISSADITGPEITGLLKADVRKFKILQYQIAQTSKKTAPESPVISEPGTSKATADRRESLQKVYATVLGLDWEVTDQGLQDLSEQLDVLQKRFAEDRYILILIQGLNALSSYIADERADAHPEAFSLIHFFYEGLRLLIEDKNLDAEKRRAILTERVNSLNNLKLLIVNRAKAVESAQKKYNFLSKKGLAAETMDPMVETVADNVITEEPEKDEIISALTDTVEDSACNVTEETGTGTAATEAELEEKLDSFFGDEFIETISENDFLPEEDEESITLETAEIAPALAGVTDEGDMTEKEAMAETDQELPKELEKKLDSFFGQEEELPTPTQAEEAGAVNSSMEAITEDDFLPEEDEESITLETAEIAPALAGVTEEDDMAKQEALVGTDQELPKELEEKLDSFFGKEEEPFEPTARAGTGKNTATDRPETEKQEKRLETVEDYKSLIKKMQVEFDERENALKQEIKSLRAMINSQ